MLSPFEWWCRNFILPDICKPCLFVFLRNLFYLTVLDGGKCILQLRGVRPFLSDKYDITKHPNYKYLSDSDKRNAFDIERFLSVRLKPKAEEVYDVYEVDLTDEEAATA